MFIIHRATPRTVGMSQTQVDWFGRIVLVFFHDCKVSNVTFLETKVSSVGDELENDLVRFSVQLKTIMWKLTGNECKFLHK